MSSVDDPTPTTDEPDGLVAEAEPVPKPRTAEDDESPFGQPGRPFRRSPFLLGLFGGLGLVLAYASYLAVRNAFSILILIFIALFLAIGLNPAVVRLRKWGVPRGGAVTIVALALVLVLGGAIGALVPPLVTQVGDFIAAAPGYIETLQRNATINDLVGQFDLVERAKSLASPETFSRALGGVFGGAKLIFGTLFQVLTVLVLTIYFMASFDKMKSAAYALVPRSRRGRVQLLTDEILAKVGAYIVGALAIAVLAGISAFVFAMIVGLAYPFALAVVVAVCDLIPQIGATIGAVIVTVVAFADSLTIGIAAAVFFLVYQQVENYLIYPKVMRKSVKVSDVAAIVAALVGVGLFGVLGALVAIPAVAAVQLIVREVVMPRQEAR
ncbi:putative PurR-regulated permease PerM [Asanoa ferruginea]|uniref:Putative PurR-regulated permease PerM n=1 Tax=Asanoa ferruginea TaxID=53367 RepID=A0A3D9ZJN0_9ACTN|nr:putative PurR-regulated permease PerM [Asanoa ferruginea]GIF48736.1 AI-2E family transporter [Asanoa ferruginea]